MQPKQRRHKKTPPRRAGQGAQNQEDQQRVHRMEQEARQVMARSIRCEQLAVERVGEPGERMPIRRVRGRERPDHDFPIQAALHHRLGGDVVGVVVSDEIIVNARQKRPDRKHQQRETEQEGRALNPTAKCLFGGSSGGGNGG